MIDVDESQTSKELSPGKMLLQGRLQAGLTQEQVAKDLYMTVSKVNALETDDYSRLNSDTFARGYIRAYANLVKLDVVAVLAAYENLLEQIKPVVSTHNNVAVVESASKSTWLFLLIIATFFLVLWLISVWFFDNRGEVKYSVTSASLPAIAVTEDNLPLRQSSSTGASLASANVMAQSSLQTGLDAKAPVNVVTSSAKSGTTADAHSHNAKQSSSFMSASSSSAVSSAAVSSVAPVVKKTSLDEIVLSFRAESWLEVSDSRGDVLATELQAAGSQRKLVGQAPFDVKLGNAPAVSIQLNGKKIEVIPLIGSNVLTLKVDN